MIKEISATARVSFKQITRSGDVFYTFEYGQTRTVEDINNLDEENKNLWNDVNEEVNKQIMEVKQLYNNK